MEVNEKTWEEFQKTGLLLLANQFLHIFGWAIVIELDKDSNFLRAYPTRHNMRGFREESQDAAYKNITKYMAKESENLLAEVEKA